MCLPRAEHLQLLGRDTPISEFYATVEFDLLRHTQHTLNVTLHAFEFRGRASLVSTQSCHLPLSVSLAQVFVCVRVCAVEFLY